MRISGDLPVALEAAIFGAIAGVAEAAEQEHGIVIKTVKFEWLEIAQIGGRVKHMLRRIDVDSYSVAPHRDSASAK